MIDLRKELDQCYLTDPTTGEGNVSWFIHDEFPFLHEWLLEPTRGSDMLVDIYSEFAVSNNMVFTSDVEKWIGEGRAKEFNAYFDVNGGYEVYDYGSYIRCAICARQYYVEQTLLASHKQVVWYATLLHLTRTRGYETVNDCMFQELRKELTDAADEFRDEHTLEGVWKYADHVFEKALLF